MNNRTGIDLHQLHAVGIPIRGLPEDPPHQEGCVLIALITNGKSMKFAVIISTVDMYKSYCTMTHHRDDHGRWLFPKMKLFFFPKGSITSN